MQKTKIVYYDGIQQVGWEEGKEGVASIVATNGEATIYFDDGRTLTITSPYMEEYNYYEAP
ncbi:hypothetical protein ACFJYZ_13450 [Enterococcus faecalis]